MRKFFTILLAIVLMVTMTVTVASADIFNDDIAMEDNEIAKHAGNYYNRVFMAARWKDGIVATLEGDEVGYFVNGNPVAIWPHETTYEDFFCSTKIAYPNSDYDLFAVLGSDICSFRDDISMAIEVEDVSFFGFPEDELNRFFLAKCGAPCSHFFVMKDGVLSFWSPYAFVTLSNSGVYRVNADGEYVFFADDFGTHVLNASLAEMNKHNQRYFSYHPIEIVDLDTDEFLDYCGSLYVWDFDGIHPETEEFDKRFGIDLSKWGHPKMDFNVEDFWFFIDHSAALMQRTFDCPEGDYKNPTIYNNIEFYGLKGRLVVSLFNMFEIKGISWESYDSSEDTTQKLKNTLITKGILISENVKTDDGGIESTYNVDGQLIHVGIRNADGSPVSYVYADFHEHSGSE